MGAEDITRGRNTEHKLTETEDLRPLLQPLQEPLPITRRGKA